MCEINKNMETNKTQLSDKEKKRRKELAILKAQNEMLAQARETAVQYGEEHDMDMENVLTQIDKAMNDNVAEAASVHGASKTEMESTEYASANKAEIKKYEKRLKKKGITHEELSRKDISEITATASANSSKNKTKRRQRNVIGVGYVHTGDASSQTEVKKEEKVEEIKQEKEVKPISAKPAPQQVEPKHELKDFNKPQQDNRSGYSIPDNVQYDIIPLPSDGKIYSHPTLRTGRIPVAYLTASDENIIVSPNMYRDGKILDVILERKILDKSIKPEDLCQGDRDAIILWLRATGYGVDFPVKITNPNDREKQYNTNINLSELKYLPFTLMCDENGLSSFFTESGDEIKFKILTYKDEEELKQIVLEKYIDKEYYNIKRLSDELKYYINALTSKEVEDDMKTNLMEDIEEINNWINNIDIKTKETSAPYTLTNTERMIKHVVSINGNTDRDYIRQYIENIRTMDSYRLRNYISHNTPGVDMEITITIPESDGGGSFTTFLGIDDAIFLNVPEL